ncbi:MAG: NADH-quinone oxidoreductase subunit J [Melioribacteraceae bacterium]|nr:NADH-quinone oxidoreductase subunit J [Melioribacteraceae bacterium]
MNIYDIIFYLFAGITIISGFLVVSVKNIVHAAFYLLFTLFGIAGLYVLLGADFIAIVQIMVYVGGILILILFGVMLTNKIVDVEIKSESFQVIPAIIFIGILMGGLVFLMVTTNWENNELIIPLTTTKILGNIILTDYILIFELLGILLLIALIGAATIARKDKV